MPIRLERQKERLAALLQQVVFFSRWMMAPFYLGMLVALGLLLEKFVQTLVAAVPEAWSAKNSDVLLTVLTLIDLSLAANLVVIVMFAGWENFVSKIRTADGDDRPSWMAHIDFTGLKMKLIGSIVAISGIYLLETFLYVDEVPRDHVMWQVIVYLTFVVSGLLMAVTDKMSTAPKD